MVAYIIKRFVQSLVVIWLVVTSAFFMIQATPGNPFSSDKASTKYVVEQNFKIYGLDKPLAVQYVRFWQNALQGEFGYSFKYEGRSVREIIVDSFPTSLKLGLLALSFAILLGVPIGIYAAVRHNTWQDFLPMGLAMLGVGLPSFVMGPLLATIFGLMLGWFNVAGLAEWSDWVLPMATIGFFYAAYFARMARAGMLETLSQDFVRTAKAKGVPGWRIVMFHALRGGLLPVLSFLGPALAGLVVGSFVVETVFRIPGLGQHFTEAALNKDYSLVRGTAAFYCALLVLANFLVDIVQVWLNPRLRFSDA
jgi:oligopeptide transport system permease protein